MTPSKMMLHPTSDHVRRGRGPGAAHPNGQQIQHDLLYLQRCAGNQAVCALLAGESKGELQISRLYDVPAPFGDRDLEMDRDYLASISHGPPEHFSKACDLGLLRPATPAVPEATGVGPADVEWISQIDPPWYRDQIDGNETVRDFRKEANAKALADFDQRSQQQILTCNKQEEKRISAIKNEQERNRAKQVSAAKVASLQDELVGLRHHEEERLEGGQLRNREAFVETMRCVLPEDPKAHFLDLKKATIVPGSPWLHAAAKDRLEQVEGDLEAQGVEMPKFTDALDLRGRHMKHNEPMGHPLGLSVDFEPFTNPQISNDKQIAMVEMESGVGHIDVGKNRRRRALVEQMGEERDTNPDLEHDPKYQAFFKAFDTDFARLERASADFRTELKGRDRELLNSLKQRYIDVTAASRELDQREKRLKAKPPKEAKELADAKTEIAEQRARVQAEEADVISRLIDAFKPWVDRLAANIRANYELLLDLDRAEPVLKKVAQAEKNIKDAMGSKKKAKKSAVPDPRLAGWQAEIDTGNQEIAEVLAKIDGKPGGGPQTRPAAPRLVRLSTMRTEKTDQIKNWTQLYQSLTGNLRFVFGPVVTVKHKGKPDTYQLAPDVRNPPIMQLIERGFFNPTRTFNLNFFKTMIKRGFDAGVTWTGSTDPMHFDFVKGFEGVDQKCGLQILPK